MVQSIFAVIITLSLLILFHEFGHFLIAKIFRVRVLRFSLGLGPKIVGIQKGETDYRVSWVPFGGYVKLAGMEEGEIKGEPGEFAEKPIWARGFIVLAGPLFNFLLALILFYFTSLLFGRGIIGTTVVGKIPPGSPEALAGIQYKDRILSVEGDPVTHWGEFLDRLSEVWEKDHSAKLEIERNGKVLNVSIPPSEELGLSPFIPPEIGEVERKSPAYEAGLRKGDVILSIQGVRIEEWKEMVEKVHGSPDTLLEFTWTRGEEILSAMIRPRMRLVPEDGKVKPIGLIGVMMRTDRESIDPLKSAGVAFEETTRITLQILYFIGQLIRREMSVTLLGGPVSIVRLTGESARLGLENLINFVGLLSINLAIFNLIFVPPLDGGYLLFLFLEGIRRKPLSDNVKTIVQNVGIALLVILVIFVTFNDIMRIGR